MITIIKMKEQNLHENSSSYVKDSRINYMIAEITNFHNEKGSISQYSIDKIQSNEREFSYHDKEQQFC